MAIGLSAAVQQAMDQAGELCAWMESLASSGSRFFTNPNGFVGVTGEPIVLVEIQGTMRASWSRSDEREPRRELHQQPDSVDLEFAEKTVTSGIWVELDVEHAVQHMLYALRTQPPWLYTDHTLASQAAVNPWTPETSYGDAW
jgi:hypothetical protein